MRIRITECDEFHADWISTYCFVRFEFMKMIRFGAATNYEDNQWISSKYEENLKLVYLFNVKID